MRSVDLSPITLVFLVAWPAAAQDVPGRSDSPIVQSGSCSCRAEGGVFEIGERTCLRTAAGLRLAQCGMALNNTTWRFTDQPCPES